MTPAQYLASCKVKMGHCSDYKLAKAWDLDDGYISKLMRGVRPIDAHVAFRIAITLNLDPATVLADIESQQQTGKRAEFWRGFLSRARVTMLTLCTLASVLFGSLGSEPVTAGGSRRRVSVA